MKLRKLTHKKSQAQAMVEFAIALPLLLLLLYGILEAGRLLFLYSTVVTASRQAVRYGSATGVNAAGVARYRDCDGIRAAAYNFNYLGGTQFNVAISHDSNPQVTSDDVTYCTGSTDGWAPADNNQRITVTVTKHFSPIVKLVPFIERDVTATSSRTILNSVAIIVEQPTQVVIQNPTTTVIDSFNPEPSEPNQSVTVLVTVSDDVDSTNTPSGTVLVDAGGGITCSITLNSNGWGTCTLIFTSSGLIPVSATYTPDDDDHIGSVGVLNHRVSPAPTVTTIVGAVPSPSIRNQDVLFTVTVTGGSTTPTGRVELFVGSTNGNPDCVITTLSNGIGSCTINFNQLGNFTITANYKGDSTHDISSDTAVHQVLTGTATPTLIPTQTPIPTITSTPTITPVPATPTVTTTAVPSCIGVTHGPITKSGNTMSMTIFNNQGFPITFQDVTVTWNEDKGHQTGSDKSLNLQGASLGGVSFWTGNVENQSTYTISASPVIPAFGNISLTFTFHQSYDNFDGTEAIYINLLTRGCESNPIHS